MSCVIVGAGKIARGFIGHILFLSGVPFVFVDKSDKLVDEINARGRYTVNVLGNPGASCTVTGAGAIRLSDTEAAAEAIARGDTVFTAVGGKNLGEIIPLLARGIEKKAEYGGKLNIITCENWKQPALILRDGVAGMLSGAARDYFDKNVGISEAVVMRSAIEADAELLKTDPLIVNVQDYWELPVDASRLAGPLPDVKYIKPIEAFSGFLERKFYTYNAANGTVSYLGALLGYRYIADAARDTRILEILEGVYGETARALSAKHNFPLGEQLAFTRSSLSKLQDKTIVDYIERNARDPMRKLGKDDRLVGSARLCLEYGVKPENLCAAIAAAIFYRQEGDPSAPELERILKKEGVDAVLEKVCSLEPDGELGVMIKEKTEWLKKRGWVK